MKKNIFKSAFAALAVSAVALSASAVSAFAGPAAGQAYDAGNLDVASSPVNVPFPICISLISALMFPSFTILNLNSTASPGA